MHIPLSFSDFIIYGYILAESPTTKKVPFILFSFNILINSLVIFTDGPSSKFKYTYC